jgi:hypothetical protein
MAKKQPAPAATIVRVQTSFGSAPAFHITGEAPEVGTKFAATLPNGVTYAGIVADTSDDDGKTLVTFKDGIAPV